MVLNTGSRVADYEILDVLGKGGMGVVYRVRNVLSNRIEAMKVLHAGLVGEAELVDRFIAEIRTIAALNHPNIAQLFTAFTVDSELCMLMEFVDGCTLSHLATARMSVDEAVLYSTQILSALAYAHELGVIHRDIKPTNVIVTGDGVAKLMDFGIAKSVGAPSLTRPGTTLGSVHYMSPEQAVGTAIDLRSDLYSMGILLYELTTGHRPFNGDTAFGILEQHMHAAPQAPRELNPGIPEYLNQAILRALEKDPAKRFQNAASFASAIRVAEPISLHSSLTCEPSELRKTYLRNATGMPKAIWMAIGSAAGISSLCALALLLSSSSTHGLFHGAVAATRKADEAHANTKPNVPKVLPPVITKTTRSESDEISIARRVRRVEAPQQQTTKPLLAQQTNVSFGAQAPAPHTNSEADGEIDVLREKLLREHAEADAISASIEPVRQQLASQGLGLRQDITVSLELVRNSLDSAGRDLQKKNYDAARQDLDRGEESLAKLRALWGK